MTVFGGIEHFKKFQVHAVNNNHAQLFIVVNSMYNISGIPTLWLFDRCTLLLVCAALLEHVRPGYFVRFIMYNICQRSEREQLRQYGIRMEVPRAITQL